MVHSRRNKCGSEKLSALVHLFRTLRSEPRLRMLDALRSQPKCVTDLTQELGLPQSNVSTHLRRLVDAGLVMPLQVGRWHYYQVTDDRAFKLLDLTKAILRERERKLRG